MVVDDGDVMGMTIGPAKDHPPLVVDPDRMEHLEVAFQPLQAVGWRHPQILEPGCSMHRLDLALGAPCDALEVPDDLIGEQPFRLSAAEDLIISLYSASRDAINISGRIHLTINLRNP